MLNLEELELKALHLLTHRFPTKRDELLEKLSTTPLFNLVDPYTEFSKYLSTSNLTKKRKRLDTPDPVPESMVPSEPPWMATNPTIKSMLSVVGNELILFMEMCNTLKLWLLMTLPRLDEGNNSEIELKEQMIKELTRAEDDAFSILDSISQFHIARGKIVSKMIKYPSIEDYQLATLQIDMKQYHQLRLTLRDIANNYVVLTDLFMKHLDQLKLPKEQSTVDIIS